MNIQFTKKKWLYFCVLGVTSGIQLVTFCLVGDVWRDQVTVLLGFFSALILTESKKWKVFLLFPLASFLPSLINVLAAYGLGAILGITFADICDSIWLTCGVECTGIILLCALGTKYRKKQNAEWSLSLGQYILLMSGVCGSFIIIGFSQVVLRNKWSLLYDNRNVLAYACLIVAVCLILLSIWQQMTLKKAYKYQVENERYKMFLMSQERHIRRTITEDEKKRKLRHDMNAHMLAMDTMLEKEQWNELHQYFEQMKKGLEEVEIQKYTHISAVDAIISEWHDRAMELSADWVWEGSISLTERVSIYELCTLFSNLLSNAVEALDKVPGERKIQIKVADFQEKIVLSVENTCENSMEVQSRPQTTKKDNHFHGLGLKSVEDIVNRHEGSICYEAKGGRFLVEVVL